MMRLRTAALALSSLGFTGAFAAECPQERAVYQSVSGDYTLSFEKVDADAAAVTHLFALKTGDMALEGLVMETEAPTRTVARIMKGCPDGDVTSDDIRACTGFEGYVYGIAKDSRAANLGPGRGDAASSVLFAGLGPALAASPLSGKYRLPEVSDSFQFKECRP
ncbi:hypothetical protein [Gellertiella hungarica]|uniref:Uncharacterized protein n=1 Tax=Gellertiella hungarica TaxID=1572859 RepID=A0A7W6J5L6_9HYPH|nr:hypothetical protein [Gellertiella hungarica]MBB4065217.1 hypothetical protein [Gellertiella hungarica]